MAPHTFSWDEVLHALMALGAAWLFALPMGWERGVTAHRVGLRTIPLVALASCAYMLLGRELFLSNPEAQARVVQGLITGIGFVGGGAILKEKGAVHGLATAAGIWSAGALGIAAATGMYVVGGLLSVMNVLILHVFWRFFPTEVREESSSD